MPAGCASPARRTLTSRAFGDYALSVSPWPAQPSPSTASSEASALANCRHAARRSDRPSRNCTRVRPDDWRRGRQSYIQVDRTSSRFPVWRLTPDAAALPAVATRTQDPASLAYGALRRSYPRQEASALAAHAGICAGRRGNRRPYRDREIMAAVPSDKGGSPPRRTSCP